MKMDGIKVYKDHLKPGETSKYFPDRMWCFIITGGNGHVAGHGMGYASAEDARAAAEAKAKG